MRRRFFLAERLYTLTQLSDAVGTHIRLRIAAQRKQLFRRSVGLRVNAGRVENVFPLRHAQEARALLKRLRPDARHLFERGARRVRPVCLAVGDNIFRRRVVEPGDIGKERRRRRVQINADRVYTVLHHAAERFIQPRRGHIVLVLPDADALRLDLHKLGQRVLQAPRDGNRGAQRNIVIREFLRAEFGRRIDARPRLVYDHVGHAGMVADHIGDKDLRLPRGRSVADGNSGDAVAADHGGESLPRLVLPVVRRRGVHNAGFQHLARLVHDGDLAAGAVGRIEAHRDAVPERRLHQQRLEILSEGADGRLVRRVRQLAANLPLCGRLDEPPPGVLTAGVDKGIGDAHAAEHLPADLLQGERVLDLHAGLEHSLPLAAVHRENAVALHSGHRLAVIVVQAVYAVPVRCGLCPEHAVRAVKPPERGADGGIVRDRFGDDIARAGERVIS